MEAIILAGGKGTRLASVVSDVPKPMALINGNPFLTYLLRFLIKYNVTHIVLSVGYKGDCISSYFGAEYEGVQIRYCMEETPLGTGGAVKKAIHMCQSDNVLLLNGDTFFDVDLFALHDFHHMENADVSVALKEMVNSDRYGKVELARHRITAFHEKQLVKHGYINGGIYFIKNDLFDRFHFSEKFSFEQFLQDNTGNLVIYGMPSDGNFIDIGIPKEFAAAQTLIPLWVHNDE